MAAKLTEAHLEQIAEYLSARFPALKQRAASKSLHRGIESEIEIRERVVRVEEELKNLRESIRDLIVSMDKRFEQVDKRFEQVDKRFELIDKRFEDVDRRFTMMMWFTGLGLTIVTAFITGAMVLLK
jgi:hypothetical protein